MQRKWKYSQQARKKRYCEVDGKRLNKDEAIICSDCLADLLKDDISEIENDETDEEEQKDEEE